MLRKRVLLLAVLAGIFILVGTDQVGAQTRRRRSRRPPATQPVTPAGDPQIISTAGEDPEGTDATRPRTVNRNTQTGSPYGMGRPANSTSARAQAEAEQRAAANLERLTQAEVRADRLRSQLFAAQDREAELQYRLEAIDIDLLPENIERINNLNGSTRPELVREQRRRYLENEKARVNAQLSQASISRNRLDGAVASADALVEKLRRIVDADTNGIEPAATDFEEPPIRETAPAAPARNNYEPPTDDEEVVSDKELVRLIKASLADAGITSVQVEAANGAVILTGDVTSAQVPAALQAAYDARPRKIYNQMTVK